MSKSKILIFISLFNLISFIGCSNGNSDSTPAALAPVTEKKEKETNSDPYKDLCGSFKLPTSGKELSYCVKDFKTTTSPENVIYFLHGLGGKPEDIFPFLEWTSPFYTMIAKIGFNRIPLIISLSFGPSEIVPFEEAGELPLSTQELVRYAIPKIESDLKYIYDQDHQPKRHLVGMSLGGFNAFNIAAENPGFFSSLAGLCPALLYYSPFEQSEINKFLVRNYGIVDTNLIDFMLKEIKLKIGTSANWYSRNPFNHLFHGKYAGLPIFISTGRADEYGFYEGAQEFGAQSKIIPSNVTFVPTTGGHCSFDINALQAFIIINYK